MNINLTLLMQAAAFAAFIWFTAKFVWPPLMRAIETRQKTIADGLAAGEQGRQALASAERRIADLIGEAKAKSAEIVAQGEKFRVDTVEAAKAEAKAEAERIMAGARAEIAQEVARAKEHLREQVAALAVAGAEKILEREVDAKAHADLLDGLVREGRFPEANAHACTPDPADPRPGIDAYGRALDALGGRFDVAILSAGEDGHCASLFPCHASVADPGERFLLVENSPKPPPRRVSASRRLLERSGLGVVVFYGEGKRDALALFRDPKVDVSGCPSKVVASIPTSYLVTDLS